MTHTVALDVHAIRRRAHERWIQRGCPGGSPDLDWLEAERELGAERGDDEPARSEVRAVTAPAPQAGSSAETTSRRRRAPRSIVTRAASAPAARLLVALVPGASRAAGR